MEKSTEKKFLTHMGYLNNELYLMLMNMRKDDINFYRKVLSCDVKSNLNKSDMAAGVALYIEHKSAIWLRKIPTWELSIVDRLIELKPGDEYHAVFLPMPSILECLRLINVRIDENHHRYYSVSKFMHRVFSEGYKDAISYVHNHNYDLFDTYAWGLLIFFGIVEKRQFDNMLTMAGRAICEELGQESLHGVYGYIYSSESLLVNFFKLFGKGGSEFIYHPCMQDPDHVIDEILKRPVPEQYKKYTYNDAREAGIGYPYIATMQNKPEGKEALRALRSLCESDSAADFLYHELYLLCQESPGDIMRFVVDLADGEFKSLDQVQKIAQTFTAFSNAVPRWELKGYSSKEVFEKYEKPELKPLPSQPFNPNNFAAKNIGRNDPCPCGSGKKYKNCHGKLS